LGRELELAHGIQTQLLPQSAPQIAGYQIVYRWQSAREVGGDFFDFIPLAPDRLGLVIADVSDKGIPAALYMMFARTTLRAAALSGRAPADMLMRTNELILADSAAEMFVTAYYSILDTTEHVLSYASAGHNLALYAAADGAEATPLITAGIPLGVVTPAHIEQKTLALQPGDVVLFYTDGVTESLDALGEEFGQERLATLLWGRRRQPAEEIAAAIETAVREFAGENCQYDDLTLIVVKRE
jgi:sigma-B regulation protein RsbU (phosphoserine phosphatase)